MRFSLVLLPLLVGCGPGIHDLSVGAVPLLLVKGAADFDAVNALAEGAPVFGALLWTGVAPSDSLCLLHGDDPVLEGVCFDPFAVAPGQVDGAVRLTAENSGSFEIPLNRLPGAAVAVGDVDSRISYGSLVLFADDNGNGVLDIDSAPSLEHGPDAMQEPSEPVSTPDRILAASFYSLNELQQRLVFREGPFDAASNFYPVPVEPCPEPPLGFSVLELDPDGACQVLPAEQQLWATPLTAQQALPLECFREERWFFSPDEEPRGPGPGPGPAPPDGSCIGSDLYVVVTGEHCKSVEAYALAACRDNLACSEPDWDFTAQPPDTWTCP